MTEEQYEKCLDDAAKKIEGISDYDWSEIVDINNLNLHYDTFRKSQQTIFGGYFVREYYRQKQFADGIATRILSISDLHIPFQKPINTFKDYVGIVDILQINGDVTDCFSLSKFSKSYRSSPMEEIIETRKYLIDLIEFIKPKKVIINFGNHDIRLQNYLSKNLDSDILELMPKTSLELIIEDGFHHYDKRNRTKVWYEPIKNVFDDVDVQYIDNWYCQIGNSIFCHPLAFKSGIMKTAESALYFFRNEGFSFSDLIMAHTHRVGNYKIGNSTIYEQGCCCETKNMSYSDGKLTNSQKEGYLYLCQDKNGKVIKYKQECLN